jgi:dipeptidase
MCTSIAVGRDASIDGSLLVARNEDCQRASWNKAMIRRTQPEWLAFPNSVANGMWTLGNGMRVSVPATSYAYTGMPDASAAIGNRFLFEERGVNSCDFAISATNSMTTNPAAQAADPFVGDTATGEGAGLAESILPTLLLPQSRCVSHALDLLSGYMETVGASESNGLFLADPSGTWYVEIGSGHHWIAVRVPAGACIAVANALRVHGVDLEDTANVRHSAGLLGFVRDHWLLAKPTRTVSISPPRLAN